MKRLLLIPFLALLSTGAQAAETGFKATLTRSACFGPCPAYSVTINGSGRVIFEGRSHTAVKGAKGFMNEKKMALLARDIKRTRFFTLKDAYDDTRVTDQITVTVHVEWDGKSKTVVHYHGDPSAPKALKILEDRIDLYAGTARWIEGKRPAKAKGKRP